MQDQQLTINQQLQGLDELYYTARLAIYEAALQSAIHQFEQAFPGLTIAFAEIYTVGSKRLTHGGMCHVLMPGERSK